MRGRTSGRAPSRGFTLYEIVASVVILAAVYLAVASLQVATVRGSRDTFENEMAREIAQHLLGEAAMGQNGEKLPVDREGVRVVDGITYHWSARYTPVAGAPAPSYIRKVSVRVRWVGRQGPDESVVDSIVSYPLVANPPPPSPEPTSQPHVWVR